MNALEAFANSDYKNMNHHEGLNLQNSILALSQQRLFDGYSLGTFTRLRRDSFQVREMRCNCRHVCCPPAGDGKADFIPFVCLFTIEIVPTMKQYSDRH